MAYLIITLRLASVLVKWRHFICRLFLHDHLRIYTIEIQGAGGGIEPPKCGLQVIIAALE